MIVELTNQEMRILELAMIRWEDQEYRFKGLNRANKAEFAAYARTIRLKLSSSLYADLLPKKEPNG